MDNQLQRLQQTELEILKVIDSFCRERDIRYSLYAGTLLGAVRHKGFIPWDDDIDICMLRNDYERLKKVPANEWGDYYVLADARDGFPFHRSLFPRMYKLGTAYEREAYYRYLKPTSLDKHPIYIDIFLLDEVDEKTNIRKRYALANGFKNALLCCTCDRRIYHDDPWKVKMISKIKRLIILIFRLTHITSKKIYDLYLKCIPKPRIGGFVTTFEGVELKEAYAFFCPKSDIFPLVDVEFDDVEIKLQHNYDAVLKKLYGDYMAFPPEDKRHNELPRVLDFGEGNVLKAFWKE